MSIVFYQKETQVRACLKLIKKVTASSGSVHKSSFGTDSLLTEDLPVVVGRFWRPLFVFLLKTLEFKQN